jgi:hypothetical protein
LGFISTVRIGAGAWRKQANTRESGDTDHAQTNLHDAQQGNRNRKKKEPKLLRRETPDGAREKKNDGRRHRDPPPLARATALHSVTLRAAALI